MNRTLASLSVLALVVAGCAHLRSTPSQTAAGGLERATCLEYQVPVELQQNGLEALTVIGTLCYEGELDGKTLQILLSGGGYGPVYYDFPYRPETYSYVSAAVRAGFATFNLSRIGIGDSSRPLGTRIDVDANAYVVHQLIELLRSGILAGARPGSVVVVGHSMGSVMAVAHAVDYPSDADGIILTGILHNTNPEYTERVRDGSGLAMLDGRFADRSLDFSYFTSKPGMREEMFYHLPAADIEVIALDEATRETLTLGEIISVGRFDREKTREIGVPVLMVIGDRDFTSCGGDLQCSDADSVASFERKFFSAAADLEVAVIEDTGHVLNLHQTAPHTYLRMLEWIERRFG